MLLVNHNDVDERVVDLPDIVRAVSRIGARAGGGRSRKVPLPSPARGLTRLDPVRPPVQRCPGA